MGLRDTWAATSLGAGGFMKRTWLILASALLISACSESTGSMGAAGSGGVGGSGGIGGIGGAGGSGGAGGNPASLYPHLDCDPLVPEFCNFPFPSNVFAVEDSNTATGRRVSLPVVALRQYTLLSSLPKYTYPPETAGEESTAAPVVYSQTLVPVVASRQYTL